MSASPSPYAITRACIISSRRCPRSLDADSLLDGWAADMSETTCTPFASAPDAAPVRLTVRRVRSTPGSQLALFAKYSYHGFITDRDGDRPGRGHPGTGGRPSPPRRDREHHPGPQVRRGVESFPLGALRRQRRLAGGPSDGAQPGPLDSAHRPGRTDCNHQDPPATPLLPGWAAHPQGPPPHPAPATVLALGNPLQPRPH